MRSNEDTKEGAMLRLLLSLTPARLVHHLGTGRALDNARRDHVETTLALAEVDALVSRIALIEDDRRAVAAPRPAA